MHRLIRYITVLLALIVTATQKLRKTEKTKAGMDADMTTRRTDFLVEEPSAIKQLIERTVASDVIPPRNSITQQAVALLSMYKG